MGHHRPGVSCPRGQPGRSPKGDWTADPGGHGACAPRHDKAIDMKTYSRELKDSLYSGSRKQDHNLS